MQKMESRDELYVRSIVLNATRGVLNIKKFLEVPTEVICPGNTYCGYNTEVVFSFGDPLEGTDERIDPEVLLRYIFCGVLFTVSKNTRVEEIIGHKVPVYDSDKLEKKPSNEPYIVATDDELSIVTPDGERLVCIFDFKTSCGSVDINKLTHYVIRPN